MLPPIDPLTLQSNPRFAALYKRLTTTILNPDGSVKVSTREARAQAKVEQVDSSFEPTKVFNLRFVVTA